MHEKQGPLRELSVKAPVPGYTLDLQLERSDLVLAIAYRASFSGEWTHGQPQCDSICCALENDKNSI
jgi:hypothetical protein